MKNQGRNQQLARPGVSRGGQSEPAGNRPITASRPAMRPGTPVQTNQATTSATAMQQIQQNPQIFGNKYGIVNVPAPANRNYSQKAGLPAKSIYGTNHGGSEVTEVGCGNTATTKEALAATGDTLPGGYNDVNYFRGAGRKQAGAPGKPSRGTSARDNARMRQKPGGF